MEDGKDSSCGDPSCGDPSCGDPSCGDHSEADRALTATSASQDREDAAGAQEDPEEDTAGGSNDPNSAEDREDASVVVRSTASPCQPNTVHDEVSNDDTNAPQANSAGRPWSQDADHDAARAAEAQRKALDVLDAVLQKAMSKVEDFLDDDLDDDLDEGLDEDLEDDSLDVALDEALERVLDAGQGPSDSVNRRVIGTAHASREEPAAVVVAPACSVWAPRGSVPPNEAETVCGCPPPLVRSVETGECEMPEVEVTEESTQGGARLDAGPVGSAGPEGSPGSTTDDKDRVAGAPRPKFKVSVSVTAPPEDDSDLLTAIAEFACRLDTEAPALIAGHGALATLPTPGPSMEARKASTTSCEESDASSPSTCEQPEERTVTAAEAASLEAAAREASDTVTGSRASGRPDGRIVSLEEAVRLTGQGWFHVKLLLVCGCLVMAAVLETVVVGYLLPSATEDLAMSDGDKALLGAASYAGIVLSSHTWGLVADTQGRKRALLCATLLDVVASLASSVAPNFETLLTLRFFCGLFTSAPAALTFAYLGEFHTPASRSRSIIWMGAFPSLGLIVLPGVAWAVLPQCWAVDLGFVDFGPWRLLLVLCALLSLLSGLLLLVALPESPKFLASRRPGEALAVLRRMYALNTRRPESEYPVDALLQAPEPRPTVATIEAVSAKARKASSSSASSSLGLGRALRLVWHQTAPLFQSPFLLHTALVCLVQFGNLASANGLQIWLPDIFNKLAKYEADHPGLPARICASQNAHQLSSARMAPLVHLWPMKTMASMTPMAPDHDLDDREGLEALAGLYADDFVDIGLSVRQPVCAPVSQAMFVNNMIIGAVSLVMPLLCGSLVNLVGKRNLLVVCLLVSGTCGVLLSVVGSSGLILGLASVTVAINAMGIGHISSIVVELFPTHLRAMAVSLHLMAGRTGSIVGNLIIGALLRTHCEAAFYAIGGALLACAALTCFLPAKGKFAS